jgi:hypothetical protein
MMGNIWPIVMTSLELINSRFVFEKDKIITKISKAMPGTAPWRIINAIVFLPKCCGLSIGIMEIFYNVICCNANVGQGVFILL